MTYGDVLRLPNNTTVLLTDGQRGRIVSWHHTSEAVSVEVGAARRIVPCQHLTIADNGMVAEIREDPGARPRTQK